MSHPYGRSRGGRYNVVVPPPTLTLEGTYATWVYQWTCAISSTGLSAGDVGFVMNDGVIRYWNYDFDDLFLYSAGVETVQDPDVDTGRIWGPSANLFVFSILGKYVVLRDRAGAGTTIHIYDTAGVVWSRDTTTDYATLDTIELLAISPNGKYIAVFFFDTVGDYFVMLYEGS